MAQVFRFFPCVRRGLAGSVPDADPPPARALASFKVTVTPEIVEERKVLLLGPGDVIGIDLRLIVRTDPRPHAFDAEPNYLASIEFDAPDFPWLFTPSAARNGKLRPWLVLIVLDADRVGLPKVSAGRPLPAIRVPADVAKAQLQNLDDASAWAHAQRLGTQGDGADAEALQRSPELNVSRLICPRRLGVRQRYLACVVPAWDAGRDAGLGVQRKNQEAALEPAWQADPGDIELPVYYHWEFTTGEQGDFEALARRLRPQVVSAVSLSPEAARGCQVYLGAVDEQDDTRTELPPDAAGSSIRFEAPLQALDQPAPSLADVPAAFARAIDRATAPKPADGEEQALTPPVYGDRFARRSDIDVAKMATHWLDELNLDPRTRLAARWGGDTVRKFQDDLMHTAWEQVGDVLDANAQISRSRFVAMAATRAMQRHTARLPADRLLMLTRVMHTRTKVDELTVSGRVALTSLPDRAFDPALRRLTSPVGRTARVAARAAARGSRFNASPGLARGLAQALQKDEAAVDPTVVERDGIQQLGIGRLVEQQGWQYFTVPDAPEQRFSTSIAAIRTEPQASLSPRADLAQTGVLTDEHFRIATEIAATSGVSAAQVIDLAVAATRLAPDAVRLGIHIPAGRTDAIEVRAIVTQPGNAFALVDNDGRQQTLFHTGAEAVSGDSLTTLLLHAPAAVPAGASVGASIRMTSGRPEVSFQARPTVAVSSGLSAGAVVRRGTGALTGSVSADTIRLQGTTVAAQENWQAVQPGNIAPSVEGQRFSAVMPPLMRDAVKTSGLAAAYETAASTLPAAADRVFVRADVDGALGQGGMANAVRSAIDPAVLFSKRAAMLVAIPRWIDRAGLTELDPISAAPVIDVPFADLFARTAPERFLPPEVTLGDNRIAALATNPRFVAAFMVGANHEMNRELLWRTYPTDSRGTSITRFWNWLDIEVKDVDSIHRWPPAAPLVQRLAGGRESQIALVIRGRLLMRYPNTHILLWKAQEIGKLADLPADPGAVRDVLRAPVFRLPIEPDITVAGFDLSGEQFQQGAGWYVVLQEPVTEGRFGLDDNAPAASARLRPARNANGLDWAQTGVAVGQHLHRAAIGLGLDAHAGLVAERLLQRPVRFAIHSSELTSIFH